MYCQDPIYLNGYILFTYDLNQQIEVPFTKAKEFYAIYISRHDFPHKDWTECTLNITSADDTELIFKFPMSRTDKALRWFEVLDRIINKYTKLLEKITGH